MDCDVAEFYHSSYHMWLIVPCVLYTKHFLNLIRMFACIAALNCLVNYFTKHLLLVADSAFPNIMRNFLQYL